MNNVNKSEPGHEKTCFLHTYVNKGADQLWDNCAVVSVIVLATQYNFSTF